MNENEQTLAAYEGNVQKYLDKTPKIVGGDVKVWIDNTLQLVPKDGNILEIGTATGRDADYIEAQGYEVERTDAAKAFVELQRSYGHEAHVLNVLTDELGGPYDLIFADAVLLHFTATQFDHVLDKVHAALKKDGVFSFTLKTGEGEEWSSSKLDAERYFNYWQADQLRARLTASGFKVAILQETEDGKWLHVIAKSKLEPNRL